MRHGALHGPGLIREEIHAIDAVSATPEGSERRRSNDDGRTWSAFETLPDPVTHPQGVRVFWGCGPQIYDPDSKLIVSICLRQTTLKGTAYNQIFCRVSTDNALTWSTVRQLTYEPGDLFDPAHPFKLNALTIKQVYFGNNLIRHSNGTLIHIAATANIPKDAPGPSPKRIAAYLMPADSRAIGSLCFIGKWRAERRECEWTAGEQVWLPRHVSSRGLMEPEVAELKDARVLVIWRGSNVGLDRATVRLPGVDAAGVLLLLHDRGPFIGVALEGTDENDAGLPVLQQGQKSALGITVHNPSQRPRAAMTARLHTLRGWHQEALAKPVPPLRPAGSARVDLAIRVPSTEREQIASLTVKLHREGKTVGTPCTVIVKLAR